MNKTIIEMLKSDFIVMLRNYFLWTLLITYTHAEMIITCSTLYVKSDLRRKFAVQHERSGNIKFDAVFRKLFD